MVGSLHHAVVRPCTPVRGVLCANDPRKPHRDPGRRLHTHGPCQGTVREKGDWQARIEGKPDACGNDVRYGPRTTDGWSTYYRNRVQPAGPWLLGRGLGKQERLPRGRCRDHRGRVCHYGYEPGRGCHLCVPRSAREVLMTGSLLESV